MLRNVWLSALVALALLASLSLIACSGDDDDDATADDDAADDDAADDDAADDDAADDDDDDDDDDQYEYGQVVGFVGIDYAEDLVCSGDYCFVAAKETGVAVVDVSNVAAPTLATTYDTPVKAWNLALGAGDTLYVADYEGGVIKLNIADPLNPAEVWTYTSTNVLTVIDLALGDNLYIGGGDGLDGWFEVVQETKDGPVAAGSIMMTGEAISSLACSGATCYGGGADGDLWKIDASAPANPTASAPYYNAGTAGHEPWGLGVTLDGDNVYYSDWGAGLIALDGDLTELSVVQTNDGVYDSAVAGALTIGGTAYGKVIAAANSQGGLAMVDITDPSSIALIGDPLDVTPAGEMADGPHGVVVMGGYAYLADNMAQGLTVVRISD